MNVWNLLKTFISQIQLTLSSKKHLEDKFLQAEFKLDTLRMIQSLDAPKTVKAPLPPTYSMEETYSKVFFTQNIQRCAPRAIEEYQLPELPAEETLDINPEQTYES